MLRRNLQIATDVVRRQLFDVARIFHSDVVTYPGGNQDFLDTLQITRAAIEVDRRLVVGVHMFANAWIDTGETAAGLLRARRFTAQHVHIGRWAAEVGDHPGKARHGIANGFYLVDDRIFRTPRAR